MTGDTERRQQLYRQWGRPESFPLARACELLGVTVGDDASAFRYASIEAARAFAASNREHHGWESVQAETPEGVIGVVWLPRTREGAGNAES